MDLGTLGEFLCTTLKRSGYRDIKIKLDTDSAAISAVHGTKAAFLVSLIPYIGKHTPAGKRLRFSLNIKRIEGELIVSIAAIPLMELFDEEEVFWFTQDIGERITDEIFARHSVKTIVQALEKHTTISLEDDGKTTDLPGQLITSLIDDPYYQGSENEFTHTPPEGMNWHWNSFLFSEFWFFWNEIWGAGLVVIGAETLLIRGLGFLGLPAPVSVLTGILTVHIVAGFYGPAIYYRKYGKWPGEKAADG